MSHVRAARDDAEVELEQLRDAKRTLAAEVERLRTQVASVTALAAPRSAADDQMAALRLSVASLTSEVSIARSDLADA